MPPGNDDQAHYWETRAESWLQAEQHSVIVSRPFGDAAIERLGVRSGDSVLDIGCGSGATTVELARRVGPGGRALGVDIAPSMIAAARDQTAGPDAAPTEFRVADAQADDLGEAAFDAAFSRFGVMFFADPRAAFANVRRSVRPGGTFGFACWATLTDNEWMLIPGAAVMEVTGLLPPMPGPGAPGPFSLADRDHVATLLGAAGFDEQRIEVHDELIDLPEEMVESVVQLSSSVGPVREALQDADDGTRAAVVGAVRSALEAKVTDGRLQLSASALVVTAR